MADEMSGGIQANAAKERNPAPGRHGALSRISFLFKTLCWVTIAYVLVLVTANWIVFFQRSGASGNIQAGALSTLVYLMAGAVVAVSFFAVSQIITVLIRLDANISGIKEALKNR